MVHFRYTLQASTFQMAVLLQFNVSKSWTIAQLEENTQIKTDFLIQVIQILLKAKLITCEDDENDLSPSSTVNLYLHFKKLVLNIVVFTFQYCVLFLVKSSGLI